MNSWETIKANMTEGSREESTGYMVNLNKAASLFMAVRKFVDDKDEAEASFNADLDVTEALVNRRGLKEIGLLK